MEEFPAPPSLPESPVPHRHFFNTKFIITFAALLVIAGGASAAVWHYNSKQSSQEVAPIFTPRPNTDTSAWQIYTNTQYGFELKVPLLTDSTYDGPETVTVSNKTYQASSLSVGDPDIRIVKGWNNSSLDPYQPTLTPDTKTINGIQWKLFYEPNGGKAQCDMATFQTVTKDQSNIVQIITDDESVCPGPNDDNQSPSVNRLEQILSTFKFVDVAAQPSASPSPIATAKPVVKATPKATPAPTYKTYTNTKFGISFNYPKELILTESPYGDRSSLGVPLEIEIFEPGAPQEVYGLEIISDMNMGQMIDSRSGHTFTTIYIGGRDGKRDMESPTQFDEFVPYATGQSVFEIQSYAADNSQLQQIESSMKFTNQ